MIQLQKSATTNIIQLSHYNRKPESTHHIFPPDGELLLYKDLFKELSSSYFIRERRNCFALILSKNKLLGFFPMAIVAAASGGYRWKSVIIILCRSPGSSSLQIPEAFKGKDGQRNHFNKFFFKALLELDLLAPHPSNVIKQVCVSFTTQSSANEECFHQHTEMKAALVPFVYLSLEKLHYQNKLTE